MAKRKSALPGSWPRKRFTMALISNWHRLSWREAALGAVGTFWTSCKHAPGWHSMTWTSMPPWSNGSSHLISTITPWCITPSSWREEGWDVVIRHNHIWAHDGTRSSLWSHNRWNTGNTWSSTAPTETLPDASHTMSYSAKIAKSFIYTLLLPFGIIQGQIPVPTSSRTSTTALLRVGAVFM